jgi:hydrogenase nickel incorporation protein HypB
MCDTCGCSSESGAVLRKPGDPGYHVHIGDHEHKDGHHHHHHQDHHHREEQGRRVQMEQDVLLKNNLLAERNRGYFEARNILALNFLSSPGSGKTSLLEKTIPLLLADFDVAVIEGDQQTTNDAERIHALGVPVVQINTGSGCHLDSLMISSAMKELELEENSLLCIENVGNLVCPAMFDLGEAMKIVVISTTEGDDKPLKYPAMFREADICILNKTDLLPYVDFDVSRCREHAMRVNHHIEWFEVSVKTGDGIDAWTGRIRKMLERN